MDSNFQNALIISVVGFTAVMVFLSSYALLIAALNKLNTIIENRKERKINSNNSLLIDESDVDADSIAVITAAVIASLGERVRIRKVSFLHNISPDTTWNNLSKTTNFQSHNINVIKKRRHYNG